MPYRVDDRGLTLVAVGEAPDEAVGLESAASSKEYEIMTDSLIEEAVKRDLRGFWIRMAARDILLLLRVVLKVLHVKEGRNVVGNSAELFLLDRHAGSR